jgi:glycerate kinase
MTILLCPDSYKECLPAAAVCEAMAAGVAAACPEAGIIRRPMADGGEGTIDAIRSSVGGELHAVPTTDCLGRAITAEHLFIPSSDTAIIESARACGIEQIAPADRDVMRASTYGVGTLFMAARDAGAKRIVVTIGGTATVDGGTGFARALGYRFLDVDGNSIPEGGGGLCELAAIQPPPTLDGLASDTPPASARQALLQDVEVLVACDVQNTLLGPKGAAPVFAPQKGASPSQVETLATGLARLADIVQRDLGENLRDTPGFGAGGGISAGLSAFAGATLQKGADVVMSSIGLKADIASADLVITGEGRTDSQSLNGKVCTDVAAVCREIGVPCVVISGDVTVENCELRKLGVTSAIGLLARSESLEQCLAEAPSLIEAATADVVGLFAAQRRSSCAD